MNEPDQIDQMSVEELRTELRRALWHLNHPKKECQSCGSTELRSICPSCLKDDLRDSVDDALRTQ